MSKVSKIEWTDSTFNGWIGCAKVSPGCDNCYAEVSTPSRTLGVVWGPNAARHRTSASNWQQPIRWNARHAEFFAEHGRRRRVFCSSLADVFDNQVPTQWRIDLMKLICETPHLDWLILTKRIGNAQLMLETAFRAIHHQRERWSDNILPNVWIGATICNQEEADRDIPKLLAAPASVRWLSMEPLLGPVTLKYGDWIPPQGGGPKANLFRPWEVPGPSIDWVVVGGESGHKARPMHPDWARDLRDQCDAAGVPFLFKQWGEWLPDNQNPSIVGASGASQAIKVGKKSSGRLLDYVQHDGYPEGR